MSRIAGPYLRAASLNPAQEQVESTLPTSPQAELNVRPLAQYRVHPAARFFRRGPWENTAVVVIALGILMLMQPFAMTLFTWSFVTILIGTAMFVIVSHFPE